MSNKDNPKLGRAFQEEVLAWFNKNREPDFIIEKAIYIGFPAHSHRFDIGNKTGSIVVECKNYSWTETGNVPSAKIRGLNEAVFYFSFLPTETEKILVMTKATHSSKSETLAEYYVRTNGHLLGDVKVYEYNAAADEMRPIKL